MSDASQQPGAAGVGPAAGEPAGGGFSAEWLALREPFDAAARRRAWDAGDLPEFDDAPGAGDPSDPGGPRSLPQRAAARAGDGRLDVVDLGCGSGSNLRHLAPSLDGPQRWWLVDHDAALLQAALETLRRWPGASVHPASVVPATMSVAGATLAPAAAEVGRLQLQVDGRPLEVVAVRHDLAGGLSRLPIAAGALVTASALLDLVSEPWLAGLLDRCAALRADVHFALTYDGRTGWQPPDPDDVLVVDLFNTHQRTDKGFGPALGPRAGGCVIDALRERGYTVRYRASDWIIGPHDTAMQSALLDGIAAAATQIAPEETTRIAAWHARRTSPAALAVTTMVVGHVDVVAWPGARN